MCRLSFYAHKQSQHAHWDLRCQIVYWTSLCNYDWTLVCSMLSSSRRWICKAMISYANHHALNKYFSAIWLQKKPTHLHMPTYYNEWQCWKLTDESTNPITCFPTYTSYFWTFPSKSHDNLYSGIGVLVGISYVLHTYAPHANLGTQYTFT